MAIDGMKVIDLDSHLVGDLESWDQVFLRVSCGRQKLISIIDNGSRI